MIRRFSSYGPIHTKLDYYVPRQELIDQAIDHLIGELPEEGGHYTFPAILPMAKR